MDTSCKFSCGACATVVVLQLVLNRVSRMHSQEILFILDDTLSTRVASNVPDTVPYDHISHGAEAPALE